MQNIYEPPTLIDAGAYQEQTWGDAGFLPEGDQGVRYF